MVISPELLKTLVSCAFWNLLFIWAHKYIWHACKSVLFFMLLEYHFKVFLIFLTSKVAKAQLSDTKRLFLKVFAPPCTLHHLVTPEIWKGAKGKIQNAAGYKCKWFILTAPDFVLLLCVFLCGSVVLVNKNIWEIFAPWRPLNRVT